MKVTLTVCDVCKSPDEPTRHYELKSERRRATADLCSIHSEVLEGFFDQDPDETSTHQRGRSRKPKVTTIEEIEELKQQEKKSE